MSLFNHIKVRTPESVELEFTLAGIGNRTIALIVDYLIWGALLIGVLMVWLILSVQIQQYFPNTRNIEMWLTAISILLSFAIYTGYFVLFETLWQGQTLGKRYTKIRVIRDDGQPVGATQAILRALVRPIDDIAFIGMLLIILTKREKRLGDWIAGTLVVQEQRPISSANFRLSPEADSLANQLVATQNVAVLLPDDFAVIREYLQRRSMLDNRAKNDLSLKLARQVRDLLEMKELPFEMTADLFLEAVYLAYQRQ
ncbi:RDD family protein [Leptolyngbya boryana CZ1]|uniref:RDD family protein n=1 Tax=Leptolyngbya boryana CZ1 TaxID=3060204 RepID=A0AA97ARN8_LEPBY|nr:RDD family protein [Leptolyngbya boryana]WNZ44305.1 RDD family protein [Leptolyngbya boryana CZ1]